MRIVDQSRNSRIHTRRVAVFHCVFDATVIVPTTRMDGNKRHACFDQPARQERPLTDRVATVAVSKLRIFGFDVERPTRVFTGNQVEGVLVEVVDSSHQATGIDSASHAVESHKQTLSVTDTNLVDSAWQVEVTNLEF